MPRSPDPNQVWAADITYLFMLRGFLYLVTIIMDWHSRYVVAWRLSNTPRSGSGGQALEADFCVDALQEALSQGRQFTSLEFIQTLQEHRVKISMDGKGRYGDNILVERLWRTVKYEEM